MAVTRETFILAFPEFSTVSEDLVNAKITYAANKWANGDNHLVMLETAACLADHPMGEQARLNIGDRTINVYRAQVKDYLKTQYVGFIGL